ncbi:hypothetical protein IW140_003704 [Coemansia sp. RSA 1813]|nr:hypothetical protein EV178_003669 [Coemansia sp. RSA 1646]KAJ1768588.1 hypothetical protein LPJ74_004746 [Coemansia sp. RSA 1843]KAJ2088708.1 hypothetical protein IW138_003980 [Coemansia sp. RSA 986]KAJ2213673.1 hypothetical protein EV179_003673 [Coemansia sp. RSA 487]KAJ2568610.1 hypothetical protein IW140_003704 [Coemansia sp. RSA 1813]
MSNTEPTWPKFFRRISAALEDGGSQATAQQQPRQQPINRSQPPPLPRRPQNQQLYQPQPLWTEEPSSPVAPPPLLPTRPTSVGIQELSQFMDAQQQAFDQARRNPAAADHSNTDKPPQRRNSLLRGSIKRPPLSPSGGPDQLDDRAPTSDRVAEFRLSIPDGVRCMTQHPEDTIVGSVVVTVTKATKAQRIILRFLGQQRVHLRDQSLSSHVSVDYTFFDKQLVLWGNKSDGEDQLETMPPGTLTIPFSIKLPRVNYPASIKRDRVCRVRYVVWAVFERPGTFVDHTVTTGKEEIRFEPIAYPMRTSSPLSIDKTIAKPQTMEEIMRGVSVHLGGVVSQIPVVPGDKLLYQLEATIASEPADGSHNYIVKRMRLVFVEKLKMRGLVRGQDLVHTHRTDIHTVKLADGNKDAAASKYASSGSVKVPLDIGAFDSKLMRREYEIRIECDVIDNASLLSKVTRQKSTFVMRVPLDVCDLSPDSFDSAAYMNAYTDESRNIASFAIPSHDDAAAEPELCIGGWELPRSYQKWNKHNDCWRELAEKKAASDGGGIAMAR